MSSAIEIRHANEGELPELCHFMRRDYPPWILDGTIYQSERFDRYLVERFRAGDLFLVAKAAADSNELLGFSHVVQGAASLHVNHMLVAESARGRGLGNRLLQDIMERADASGLHITLDVDSRNPGAIKLYRRAGFEVESATPISVVPRRSGVLPPALVAGHGDYTKYGFCYVDYGDPDRGARVGIVGERSVRLMAKAVPGDFDWKAFFDWAGWADIYVFGKDDFDPACGVESGWIIYRMKK